MNDRSRRELFGATAGLAGLLAGCAGVPGRDASEDQSYDRLQVTAVYVDPNVDLSLPGDVQTVEGTHNADFIVLPGDTAYGPDRAVDWLDADRVLALLGEGAERRWLDWARSDVFLDTFENRGYGDAEPDPSLVVAAAIGLRVRTYRRSWGDPPRDRDRLRAIDEALADVASRRTV